MHRKNQRPQSSAWTYSRNNELLGFDTTTFSYDENGNAIQQTINAQITVYNYNAEDRLESIQLPDGRTATYTYDPLGRRIKKQIGAEITYFVYSDEGLLGEYDSSGNLKRAYGWSPTGIWGTAPVLIWQGDQYYFFDNDHQGSPVKITNRAGTIVWSGDYDAFGNCTVDAGSTIINNFRFPGQYFDEETELHNNWNRYYLPKTGLYRQVDPLGLMSGINVYGYVENNPLNFIDPLGLRRLTIQEREKIIKTAKSWEGTPYSSEDTGFNVGYQGDKAVKKKGADCSGAVWAIYREAGLPFDYRRSSDGLDSKRFNRIYFGNPEIGDVGWWNGHVVIYGGKGENGQEMVYTARGSSVDKPFGNTPLNWYEKKSKATWYSYDVNESTKKDVTASNKKQKKSPLCKKCRRIPIIGRYLESLFD